MPQSQPLISVLHRMQSDSEWLNSVRHHLGCDGVGIRTADGQWPVCLGAEPPDANWQALLCDDGAVFVLPSGGGIISTPLFTAYESYPRWAIFWIRGQTDLTALYATLAKATAILAKNALSQHRLAADHHAELIERAAATARIGVWGCTLPDETLSWSDGVYDLFELPRRTMVSRAQVLKLYTPEASLEMDRRRKHAIATLSGFSLDAAIVTAKGNKRIIRITAAVDHKNGVPTHIYGVKQDITAEHALVERTRSLAETDPLTGLANRMRFQACLDDLHGEVTGEKVGALLLIDLDEFKSINDTYGHLAGDTCLIEVARRLKACAPKNALVARLGGDEFAIITDATAPCDGTLPKAIMRAFAEPMMLAGHLLTIGISIGIAARKPTDVADSLYHNADMALYEAKQSGRGTWRVFHAA